MSRHLQGQAKCKPLYMALQKVSKSFLYDWLHFQNFFSIEFHQVTIWMRNKRQGVIINYIVNEIESSSIYIYQDVVQSLKDLKTYQTQEELSQVKLLEAKIPEWYNSVRNAKERMINEFHNGQIVWIHEKTPHVITSHYPAKLVKVENYMPNYVPPDLRESYNLLHKHGKLPSIFSQDVYNTICNQFIIIPLTNGMPIEDVVKRFNKSAQIQRDKWITFVNMMKELRIYQCNIGYDENRRITYLGTFSNLRSATHTLEFIVDPSTFGKWKYNHGLHKLTTFNNNSNSTNSASTVLSVKEYVYTEEDFENATLDILNSGIHVSTLCCIILEYSAIKKLPNDWLVTICEYAVNFDKLNN